MNNTQNAPWNNFNDAAEQSSYDIIPAGTIAKVRMTIRPGGFDNPEMGWTGGYATRSESGAIYLNAEFVIVSGEFAKRKIWSLIGMFSPKGPDWENMGRSFVRGILQSARNIKPEDNSPPAYKARQLMSLSELDGIEFVAKIALEKDQYDEPKNVIKQAITPDNPKYAQIMQGAAPVATAQVNQAHANQNQLYAPHDQTPPHPVNNQWD